MPSSPSEDPAPKIASTWTPRRVIFSTLTVLTVALGFYLIYQFYIVIFVWLIAVMLSVAIEPAVNVLRGYGIRREIGIILVYALILALIDQAGSIARKIPQYYQQFHIQQLEGTLLAPRVMDRAVGVNPIVSILAFAPTEPRPVFRLEHIQEQLAELKMKMNESEAPLPPKTVNLYERPNELVNNAEQLDGTNIGVEKMPMG